MDTRTLELAGLLTEMKSGGKFYDKNGEPKDIAGAFSCDHRDSPDEVMKSVDKALKPFGLQVVSYNTDGDEFVFAISKK